MQLSEIIEKLQRGDKARIARIVGCANGTVNAVLMGWRNPETELSMRIIAAAAALIQGTSELDVKLRATFADMHSPQSVEQ